MPPSPTERALIEHYRSASSVKDAAMSVYYATHPSASKAAFEAAIYSAQAVSYFTEIIDEYERLEARLKQIAREDEC